MAWCWYSMASHHVMTHKDTAYVCMWACRCRCNTVQSTQYTALYCYCNVHTTVQYYAVLCCTTVTALYMLLYNSIMCCVVLCYTALYSTVLYYTSVIHWSCCTVLYFCKTLIIQYRILSCRVLCIYYWCTWAVLSHLWCADRTELCCTVLFGLHSTSRDGTELSRIILQPTTVLCSTALCTYSDTMLWGIVLHCTVLHWAVLSTLCDDAWHDSTDDVTYDALMQYIALHCDVTH